MKGLGLSFSYFFYIFMAHCEKFEETVILNVPAYLPWKLKATSTFFSFSLVATLNGLPLQFLQGNEGILWTFMMSYIVLSSHGWNWANVRANAVSTEVFLHLLYWSLKKNLLVHSKKYKEALDFFPSKHLQKTDTLCQEIGDFLRSSNLDFYFFMSFTVIYFVRAQILRKTYVCVIFLIFISIPNLLC